MDSESTLTVPLMEKYGGSMQENVDIGKNLFGGK